MVAQLLGMAFARYLMRLEPLATATPEQLATWIGPSIQRYLTADLAAD